MTPYLCLNVCLCHARISPHLRLNYIYIYNLLRFRIYVSVSRSTLRLRFLTRHFVAKCCTLLTFVIISRFSDLHLYAIVQTRLFLRLVVTGSFVTLEVYA